MVSPPPPRFFLIRAEVPACCSWVGAVRNWGWGNGTRFVVVVFKAKRARQKHATAIYVWRLENRKAAPEIDLVDQLQSADRETLWMLVSLLVRLGEFPSRNC